MFKKVIGQDVGETSRPAPSAPETAAPRPPVSNYPTSAPAQQPPAQAQPQAAARPSGATTRNVLSSDVEIKGTVKFTNDLVVDGKIEGEITSDGNLTIGENARIKAEVRTGTVVVYGKVHGNLTAADRVELKSSAEVIGDIKAKILSIEAGAIFVGKSTVGAPAETASSGKPAAQSAPKQEAAGAAS